jgi:hypothetical protein
MKIKTRFAFIFLLCFSYGFAQTNQHYYKREISGINNQWHKIIIPDEIFSKIARDFSDVRIIGLKKNKDTINASYILQIDKEKISQKEAVVYLVNQSKNNNGYYYTFEIPSNDPINQIHLDFGQNNFDWKSALEGSHNQQDWFTITEDYRILSIKNKSTDYQFTKVIFPDSRYRYFRLLIKSAKDPELVKTRLLLDSITEGNYKKYAIRSIKIEEEKQEKRTVIEIDLKSMVPVSKLTITTENNFHFYRPVNIEYLEDSIRTERGWVYNYTRLASATLSSLEKNSFRFNSTILKKLRVIIENHDNAPLQPDIFVVEGYIHKLICRITEPASYFLTYGDLELSKPQYDLERFTNEIPQELTSLTLGSEQLVVKAQAPRKKPLFENKAWLWAIISIIIVLLGWFSIRMIKAKQEGEI